jgi:response regulator RpfG family c-di-GMP phosphodiesterase
MALRSEESIWKAWHKTFLAQSLDFLVSASAAGIIAAAGRFNIAAPLFVAPSVGAIWAINIVKTAKERETEMHVQEQAQLYGKHLTTVDVALAVDQKSQASNRNVRRVRAYALGLARLSGIENPKELMGIETAALLHDVGESALSDSSLKDLGPGADYVRCCNERWDGLGQPNRIKGEKIPLGARILSIARGFDEIHGSPSGQPNTAGQDSIELLRAGAGTHYDPRLVQLFIDHIDEIETSTTKS